jgi:hypothetical protein
MMPGPPLDTEDTKIASLAPVMKALQPSRRGDNRHAK